MLKEMVTVTADDSYLLQLPDDVKQNIEDAGARYVPYVYRRCLELMGMHTDPNVGEMVLPMMMIQDDQAQDQRVAEFGNIMLDALPWMP